MRGRKAVSAASVIIFALAVVLSTTVATYLSYSAVMTNFAAKKTMEEMYDRGKHEVRATLIQGMPPGWSPKAYIVVHEESGEGDMLLDILVDKQGAVTVKRADLAFEPGQCRVIRLERLGLPRASRNYANSTLIIHMGSGAVGKAYTRILEPDEVYPCGLDPPERPGMFTVNIRVTLDGQVCGSCRGAVTPEPGNHMFNPYEIAVINASSTLSSGGGEYVFSHWEVSFTGFQDTTIYRGNPLPLFVDDHYFVTAVYVAGR